jgi:hypothetical protein
VIRQALAVVIGGMVLVSMAEDPAAAASRTRTYSATVKTDAMPTTIKPEVTDGVMRCVRAVTGAGWDRDIAFTLKDEDGDVVDRGRARVKRNTSSACLRGVSGRASKGSVLSFEVVEDIVGPWNPSARGSITVTR